jgi:hypothetical protein
MKKEHLYSVSGNVNKNGYYGKWYEESFSLLSIFLKEQKSICQRDVSTSIFIAVVFMIAKIWSPPGCPSIYK